MKDILILAPYYLPGYKGGGPIRSISNLIHMLGKEFKFKVITTNRDLGDLFPYKNVRSEVWTTVGDAEVYYIDPKKFKFSYLKEIIKKTNYDFIYINSFFSKNFSIMPLLLRKIGGIPNKPIIVAPRGEFSSGALKIKRFKKELFIKIAKLFGLHKEVIWHATSEGEKADIEQNYEGKIQVRVAPNLPNLLEGNPILKREKVGGELKLIFISRITKKKNLKGAITLLKNVIGNITFDIYGPIENKDYWEECQKIIRSLPANITVNYMGQVSNDKVHTLFASYDAFLFPTFGENYGHVIVESLLAGCPVIISNQTPWKNLRNKKAGWAIPLEKEERFIKVIHDLVHMNSNELEKLSKNAVQYAANMFFNDEIVKRNRNLFSIN